MGEPAACRGRARLLRVKHIRQRDPKQEVDGDVEDVDGGIMVAVETQDVVDRVGVELVPIDVLDPALVVVVVMEAAVAGVDLGQGPQVLVLNDGDLCPGTIAAHVLAERVVKVARHLGAAVLGSGEHSETPLDHQPAQADTAWGRSMATVGACV